mgnify:CR=1 FL=1
MNYSAMIQNRKSVRAFRGKEVPNEVLAQLRTYYEKTCPRLVPEIATELIVLDKDAQPALESSAGYQQFLIGAPHYLLLMSARHIHAGVNAGYMMEDLVLKLTELDIDTCWLTFTDSDKIKKALSLTTPLEVAAIVAFGYGEKTAKKLRMNIQSMSQIDVQAEQQYYAPKKSVHELVHMESWSNKSGLDEMMDFYDDMLWQAFYAASLSPSYLNRQPYGFLVRGHSIYLVQQEDAYTDNLDAALDLGIVLLHFSAVASQWAGRVPQGIARRPCAGCSGAVFVPYWEHLIQIEKPANAGSKQKIRRCFSDGHPNGNGCDPLCRGGRQHIDTL